MAHGKQALRLSRTLYAPAQRQSIQLLSYRSWNSTFGPLAVNFLGFRKSWLASYEVQPSLGDVR